MNTSLNADITHQQISTSMTDATLQAIRAASFHGTHMVIQLDGCVQTIRPEQHPLYAQAMHKDMHSSSS